jgi:nucleoside-diphosphate-sugar epimerase
MNDGDMTGHVLVVGASGLVGEAAVESFAAQGWTVTALSRRRPVVDQSHYRYLNVDLTDRAAAERAVEDLGDVTHVVYAAVSEQPNLVHGWTEQAQIDRNTQMMTNVLDPLSKRARLQHVSILQGTKAYGAHLHRIAVPARETLPRDPHASFYWTQEDYLTELARERNVQYTILRPSFIIGPTYGVAMNVVPVIGVYAAICADEGRPCGFPGGAEYAWEAVGSDLLARALVWAATCPAAWGQHYNITNGEAFSWRSVWQPMVEIFGAVAGAPEPVSMEQYLPTMAGAWAKIASRHRLAKPELMQVLGSSASFADFAFAFGFQKPPPAAFMSTVKIKTDGFTEAANTETMLVRYLELLVARGILPGKR